MSFYLAKFFWIILNPLNILIFLTLLSFIFFTLNFNILKKISLSLLILFFVTFCILPTGNLLIYYLEKKFYNFTDLSKINDVDGILILGGSTDPQLSNTFNQINFKESAERLFEAARAIKKFPNAKIIFSGGSGKITSQDYTESSDAKIFFEQQGIDVKKLIFDDKSRNTYENIIISEKLSKQQSDEKWLVISSAYHLNRAIKVAENIDWDLHPYATDFQINKNFKFSISLDLFRNLSAMHIGSHEWIGTMYYYFTNKIKEIY